MTKRRPDSKEPHLSPRQFANEVTELGGRIFALASAYVEAHDEGGWPSSGEGVHVNGGSVSNVTRDLATAEQGFQLNRRQDCRLAVEWVREAAADIAKAEKALRGEPVEQPEKVDSRATITQSEFDRRRSRIRVWRAGGEETVR